MKFADIEVGKIYKNLNPGNKRVVFRTDTFVVVETDLPYPTVYGPNEDNFSNWVEVKTVKLYCAVWHDPKSAHSFIQAATDFDAYGSVKKAYLSYNYKLIREFVEEFSV